MASQAKRNIGCFTADFRGNKVAVGGKVFPAGFFLGKRSSIRKEYRVDGYKADLFISNTKTIIEVKSIIALDEAAVFPTVYSERALKQLKQLKELLQRGYNVWYFIVSLNPYVQKIQLDSRSELINLLC